MLWLWNKLAHYELPPELVKPAVEACRLFNGVVDEAFYNVPGLKQRLAEGAPVARAMQGTKDPRRIVDFDALRNPEGCLLLIDPATPPYVHRYLDVKKFLGSRHPETRQVQIVTITGVGSSALGSAAFAWDIAVAEGKPVLAIVPGYGVADMVQQALGGWFGFGLHDWFATKSIIQTTLARTQPKVATIGRELSASTPGAEKVNGAPVFRQGSGSSDVLHALLDQRPNQFKLLVGHSKGALQIGNAIRSLAQRPGPQLRVVTMGCPIAEDSGATYRQSLGLLDTLGQMNAWGHFPDLWMWSWHTTNPTFPPAMDVPEAL